MKKQTLQREFSLTSNDVFFSGQISVTISRSYLPLGGDRIVR